MNPQHLDDLSCARSQGLRIDGAGRFAPAFSAQSPRESLAAALCDPELGLIWLHAESIQTFVGQCLHLDSEGCGFVVDTEAACLHRQVALRP